MASAKGIWFAGFSTQYSSSTPSIAGFSLDGATDAWEVIFQAEEVITITHLGFRLQTKTGTSPTYRISLQGVSAGNPDGTVKGGGSPASATFTATALTAGDFVWIALDNSYVTTRGQLLAFVIEYSSGTIDGSNFIAITSRITGFINQQAFPFLIQNAAGVRTKAVEAPWFGYKSSTVSFGTPIKNIVATNFSSDSTPNEYALKFVYTAEWSDTFKVKGARIWMRTPAAAKTIDVTLYEGTTVKQAITFDSDDFRGVNQAYNTATFYFDEATLESLTFGTTYYLAIKPNEVSSNLALPVLDVQDAGDLSAFSGGASQFLATRAGAGWTDVTTSKPIVELILDDITEPSGGGGGGAVIGGIKVINPGSIIL